MPNRNASAPLVLIAIASLGWVSAASAGPLDRLTPAQTAAIDEAVRREMEGQKLIGVAVGVVRYGEIVHLRGYGLADREAELPVTERTVFNWASNSKPVAAVMAAQLAAEGRLDLDADVRDYVPEFPEKRWEVTTRHLLCHQGGIPHYSNGRVIGSDEGPKGERPLLDPVLAIKRFDRSPLLYRPGQKTSYSSYAYVLLSAVIQRAGERPFRDQVTLRVSGPLGMGSLQYDAPHHGQPNWAVGYQRNIFGGISNSPEEAHDWKHGAGGFKSDVQDFALWARGLLTGRLMSRESEATFWSAQATSDGKAASYGLGFRVGRDNGPKISHGGSQRETRTQLSLYPREELGVVVMSNCSYADVGAIADAVRKAVRGERAHWWARQVGSLSRAWGRYVGE